MYDEERTVWSPSPITAVNIWRICRPEVRVLFWRYPFPGVTNTKLCCMRLYDLQFLVVISSRQKARALLIFFYNSRWYIRHHVPSRTLANTFSHCALYTYYDFWCQKHMKLLDAITNACLGYLILALNWTYGLTRYIRYTSEYHKQHSRQQWWFAGYIWLLWQPLINALSYEL